MSAGGLEGIRIPRGQVIDQTLLRDLSQRPQDPDVFAASVQERRRTRVMLRYSAGYLFVILPLLLGMYFFRVSVAGLTSAVAIGAAAAVAVPLALLAYDRATVGAFRRRLHAAYMLGG